MAGRTRQLGALVAVGAGFALGACKGTPGNGGERLFQVTCSRCHTLGVPLSKRKDAEGWRRTVWVMRQRGARLTDAEAEEVVRYLTVIRGE